jgi:hypothetical protein
MRNLINIFEDPALKKQVIDVVKSTDDTAVLQKVLNTLKAGNIEERITGVLSKDADASRFIKQIAQVIVHIDAPVESKDAFLKQYKRGIIDTGKLLDGNAHSFDDLINGDDFAKELFIVLAKTLTSQGVGPGEVALAVMSPDISWSGRAVGGGDIQVGNKAVEVKTSISSGGRWINTRKANMNMQGILKAIQGAMVPGPNGQIEALPERINPDYWVNKIRPVIDPNQLNAVTKVMADGLFNAVDNSRYQQALEGGAPADIREAILAVGFDNYKEYSKFDGMLLMDVKTESAQYFEDYDSMIGKIKSDMPYIYGPESEGMPKVTLLLGDAGYDMGASDSAPTAPVAAPKSIVGGHTKITPPGKRAAPAGADNGMRAKR